MIELKRLKLINWHNFENVTFDCARLTYMIGVNAVGKTTILDAIRYCLTTNRSFNALGNKKSGRTLQGSVHAKQRGENAYRRPGRTVAYIGAEFWDSAKRTPFVIAVRVESEGPMQELHPGDQTWYLSEDGCTLEQLPFIDPRTGAPSSKENFKPAVGRLSYTRSPSEARDRICRALGIGRASSPLGKKFNEVFQMGTSMDEIPNFREFLYQYILPQPELDLDALQGDRLELENLHAVLAEAKTRADALEEIVNFGREAAEKQTQTLVNRGAALLDEAGCHYVVTPNPEIVEVCRENPEAMRAVNGAALVLPDGIGVIKGAAMLGTPLKEKTPGIEFAMGLMGKMAERGKSLYLLGAKPGVAEQAAARLKAQYPGLKIAGTHDGYFKEDAPVVEAIRESGADCVFVCLGAPKQELWMEKNGPATGARLLCGLGGSMDVFAGTVERAPKFWSDHGLEWFYRLCKEPKRVGRMLRLPLFLVHVRQEKRSRK